MSALRNCLFNMFTATRHPCRGDTDPHNMETSTVNGNEKYK